MPFAATWMDLEIIILSEVIQEEKEIPYDIAYISTQKYDKDQPIYKTETDSPIREWIYGYHQRVWMGGRDN